MYLQTYVLGLGLFILDTLGLAAMGLVVLDRA